MNTFVWTAIAVVVGIWAYAKITEPATKKLATGPAGYPLDALTGVEQTTGNGAGTVGFASGPIDNFAGPSDGAYSSPDGGWSIKY